MEQFIELVVILVLIYTFENKVLPQILVMGTTMSLLIAELGTNPIMSILFALTLLYSGISIFYGANNEN